MLPWPLVLGGPWGLLGAAVQSQDQAPGLAGSVDSGLLGAEAAAMRGRGWHPGHTTAPPNILYHEVGGALR